MKAKNMKKLLAVILVLGLLAALMAGCTAEKAPEETVQEETTTSEAPAETSEPQETASDEAEAEPEPEIEAEEAEDTAYTVSYPLNTSTSLTMVAKLEANMQNIIESFDEVLAMQVYMEKTGVDVTFQMLGDTVFSEQLNLLISADDLPDMIQGSMAGYASKLELAIEDEVLADIVPYLEQYAPDYYALLQNDEAFAEQIYNSNGTTSVFNGYGLPTVDSGMYVRGDWMDALGLETPTTLSELTDVLRAFHSEYGTKLTLLTNSNISTGLESTFNTTASGFEGLTFQLTAPDSGVVVAGIASQGYRDYLDYMKEIYAEGLIDDSFISTSKQLNTYNQCYWNGDCGVWNEGNRCADPAEYSNAKDAAYQPRPIARVTLDDGTPSYVSGPGSTVGRGQIYVTAACSDLETAVSFMNYAYTDEGITLCTYGIEGQTFNWIDEEHVEYTDMISGDPNMAEKDAEVLYLLSNWMPSVQTKAMFNLKNSVAEVREAAELWTENCGEDSMCLPDGLRLSTEDSETVTAIANDILTLLSEKACLYVMGQLEGSYDDVLSEAETMGLSTVTEIYQATYDAYMDKHR